MTFGWRKHALITLLAVSMSPFTAAVELGSEQVYSFLNEPFLAEIELEDWQDVGLENIQIELGSRFDFESFSIPYMPELEDLRFSIEEGENGRAYILVTGRNPLKEPYLDFLLKARWSGGMIVREYIVLLDIPDMTPEPARQVPQPVVSDPVTADGPAAVLLAERNTQAANQQVPEPDVNSRAEIESQVSNAESEGIPSAAGLQDEPEVISQTFTPDESAGPAENATAVASSNDMFVTDMENTAVSEPEEQPVRVISAEPDTVVQQAANTDAEHAPMVQSPEPASAAATADPGPTAAAPVIVSQPQPEPQPGPQADVSQQPEPQASTRAQPEAPAHEVQPRVEQTVSPRSAPATGSDRYLVMPGDTLWQIAGQHVQSGSDISIYQAMLSIYASNMDAFVNRNFTLLKANQNLVIPDSREMARFSRREAIDIINDLTENGQARVDALRQGLPLPEFTDFPVLLAENAGPSEADMPEPPTEPQIRQIALERPPEPRDDGLLTPVSSQAALPVLTQEEETMADEEPLVQPQVPVIPDTDAPSVNETATDSVQAQRENEARDADSATAPEPPTDTEETVRLENLLAERQAEILALEEQMRNMQVQLEETENTLQRLNQRLEEQDAITESVQGTMTTIQRGGLADVQTQPAGLVISPFMLRLAAGMLVLLLFAGAWMYWRNRRVPAMAEWEGIDDLDIPDEEFSETAAGQPAKNSVVRSASVESDGVRTESPDVRNTGQAGREEMTEDEDLSFTAYDNMDDNLFADTPELVEVDDEDDSPPDTTRNDAATGIAMENLELEGFGLDVEEPEQPGSKTGDAPPPSGLTDDGTAKELPDLDHIDLGDLLEESTPVNDRKRSYSPESDAVSQTLFSVSGGQGKDRSDNFDDLLTEINLEVSDQANDGDTGTDQPDITSLPWAEDDGDDEQKPG